MVSHDDFTSFEQRPHGLMEVIIPGDCWHGTPLEGELAYYARVHCSVVSNGHDYGQAGTYLIWCAPY